MDKSIVLRYVGMFNGTQSMGKYLVTLWGNRNVRCVKRNTFRVFDRFTVTFDKKKWVVQ